MARRRGRYDWRGSMVMLSATVLWVAVTGCLYWGQELLIPIMLAVFVTFILGPAVAALERRRVPRLPAVLSVALLALFLFVASGWIIARQFIDLGAELPKYSDNIRSKVRSLRAMTHSMTATKMGKLLEDVVDESQGKLRQDQPASAEAPQGTPAAEQTPVVMQGEASFWLGFLPRALSSIGGLLTTMALSFVLVIFMLLKRENLRNRFIRLFGQGHVTATTKAVDEASDRISRFLMAQLIVNAGYGLVLALGLFLIGVDYPLLWGFLAALLRYIPYLGGWIAAAPPIILALAMFDGWTQPMLVISLFAALELLTANVIEPWFFGQSMGVSEVGLLVAAAFWALLWGPIGLVLSYPLTACLVVLGKHVRQFAFFDLLLGDEPALSPHVTLYQRLLARDEIEAHKIVMEQTQTKTLEELFDGLLLPALSFAKRDRYQDALDDEDEEYLIDAVGRLVTELGAKRKELPMAAAETEPSGNRVVILACPAQDEADRLALVMLGLCLDTAKWDLHVGSIETLAAEVVNRAIEEHPDLICVSSLAPGGMAHSRYLCKRIRSELPAIKIVVGRWGLKRNISAAKQDLERVGANHMETTIAGTKHLLTAWLPVLKEQQRPAAAIH